MFHWCFRFDNSSSKIIRKMKMNTTEVVVTKPGPVVMELHAIIAHWGPSVNRGHYVAYVKNGGRWYLANDTKVHN